MKNTMKSVIAVVSLLSLFIPKVISQVGDSSLCDSPVNRDDIKYTSPKR